MSTSRHRKRLVLIALVLVVATPLSVRAAGPGEFFSSLWHRIEAVITGSAQPQSPLTPTVSEVPSTVGVESSPTTQPRAITPVRPPSVATVDTTAITASLKSDLLDYIRAHQPVPVIPKPPELDLGSLKQDIENDILSRIPSPSSHSADGLASAVSVSLSSLQNGGTFTSPTITGAVLTGTSINGFGLSGCNSASSALTWSGGLFGCHTIAAGGGSASDKFATSTNGLTIYPNAASAFVIGQTATTSLLDVFEVTGGALFDNATTTSLFSTMSNLGVVTSGLLNGQTISSAANFTGSLAVTGGLSTLSNLLLTGSSTLQNFTFANATGTAATTTSFFSTTASSTNLFAGTGRLGALTVAGVSDFGPGGSGASPDLYNMRMDSVTSTVAGDQYYTGQEIVKTLNKSSGAASDGQIMGLIVEPRIGPTNTSNWSSTFGQIGIYTTNNTQPGSTGTLTNAYGMFVNGDFGSMTIANRYGIMIETPFLHGGSITNGYGLYIKSPGGGTINDAIHVEGGRSFFGGAGVFGGSVQLTGSLTSVAVPSNGAFVWASRGQAYALDNGIIQLLNGASNGFTRLVLGMSDATGAAIAVSGTSVSLVRGDGTGNAALTTGALTSQGAVTFPAITAGAGTAYVCTTLATGAISSSTTACNPSSIRFKDNVQTLSDSRGLALVMQMRPVTYTYKSDMLIPGNQIGFIAEEMAPLVPEVVGLDASGTPANIDYSKLTPILAKAIQELNQKVDGLASTTSTSTQTITDGSGFAENLGYVGGQIVNGVIHFVELAVDTLRSHHITTDDIHVNNDIQIDDGIVLKDADTGQPVCVRAKSGVLVSTPGDCGVATDTNSGGTSSSTESLSPTQDNGDAASSTDASSTPPVGN